MPLQPERIGSIPDQTARVARAAFPGGNAYLRMGTNWNRLSKIAILLTCSQGGASQLSVRGAWH